MSHSSELEIIRFIQEFRNPILDGFFKFLDFFDRQEFFFVLIPAVWLGKGWKWGLRLFYILFLSSLTNHALKEFFLSPRPFHYVPRKAGDDSTIQFIVKMYIANAKQPISQDEMHETVEKLRQAIE